MDRIEALVLMISLGAYWLGWLTGVMCVHKGWVKIKDKNNEARRS